MDVKFLNDISEAYIIDKDLKKLYPDCDSKSIADHLYELVKDLRETDIELYDKLYDRDKVTQQQIFEKYLNSVFFINKEEIDTLNEIGLETGFGILTLIVMGLVRKPLARNIFSAISIVGKFFDSLGKKISTQGKYWKFRYAIIQQNSERCYRKCGVTQDNLAASSYLALTKDTMSTFISKLGDEQADCLSTCYVDDLVQSIGLFVKQYFICLKNTGTNIRDTDPDEIMKLISKTNINSQCEQLYKDAKDAFSNFEKVLDFLYGQPELKHKKQKALDMLRGEIYKVRDEISNAKDFNKYKK
jgi:hypothetical protein